MKPHKPELVAHAEIDQRPGNRQDPAAELLMRHVNAGDVMLGDVWSKVGFLKRYGVTITVEVMAQLIAETIKGKRPEPPQRPKLADVVYYMRIGDRVKIGTSTNLVERLKTFNPEELMVTEPGGPKVERSRHKQFANLRVNGEWFRLESPLIEHIAALKEKW